MRILIILAALALVAVASPVTADGVDVSVRYLDETSACTEAHDKSSIGRSDNDSYWYRFTEQHSRECADEYTYASASAATDNDSLATVSADGREDSRSSMERTDWTSRWWSNSSTGSSQHSRAEHEDTEGWSRDATVETMAGDARVSRGCSSASSFESESSTWDYSDRWGNGSYRYGGSSDAYSYTSTNECHDSVTAGDATVARQDTCSRSDTGSSYQSHFEHDSGMADDGSQHAQGEDACFNGVTADAAGEHARAGSESACAYEHADAYHDSRSGRQAWSFSSTECRSGIAAYGPLGSNAFAGYREWSWQSCDGEGNETRCEGDAYRNGGADAQWEQSPTGPLSLWFYRSLP